MMPLTDEEKQKICHIYKKFITDKVRDHCHYTRKYGGAAHNNCNLRYKTPKQIPVVFHKGSKYDYHFIIKKLAKEFDGQLENTEKYNTFSVPFKKHKLKFIDSFRFMPTSLSSLVNSLSEGL